MISPQNYAQSKCHAQQLKDSMRKVTEDIMQELNSEENLAREEQMDELLSLRMSKDPKDIAELNAKMAVWSKGEQQKLEQLEKENPSLYCTEDCKSGDNSRCHLK